MKKLITPLLLILLAFGDLVAQETGTQECPVCSSKSTLVTLAELRDDENEPSKNLAIWNRSSCGNFAYLKNSLICTNCWYGQNKLIEQWELALGSTNGFHRPLREEIAQFPLPNIKSGALYRQLVLANSIVDRISMWTKLDADYEEKVRAYCKTNNIGLELNKHRNRGKMLIIGGVRTRLTKTKPPPAGYENYVVKEGDTLSSIAKQFGDRDSLDEIVKRNHITNIDVIHKGQVLWIKRSEQ